MRGQSLAIAGIIWRLYCEGYMQCFTLSAMQDGQPPRPGYAPAISACFGPQDFRIGTSLTVYGRHFLIHDCDAFTRTWLQVP